MTHSDFNHLLSSLKALSPEQMRRLRQQIDSELAQPKKPAPPARKGATRTKAAPQQARKPLTEAEFNQHLLSIGLIRCFPVASAWPKSRHGGRTARMPQAPPSPSSFSRSW
jgi:hypothetical protein